METRIDRGAVSKIAVRYNLRLVILYGSRATGRHTGHSDYDIGVWFDDHKNMRGKSARVLYRDLFEQFASTFASRRAHLAILNRATPLLLWEVANNGRPLYEKNPGAWTEFRVLAAKKHWDNRKFYDAERLYPEKRYGGMRWRT